MKWTAVRPTGMPDSTSDYSVLAGLLRRRLEVIADHAWRDSDPEGHLEALKEVSLAVDSERERLAPNLPARLAHFLFNASYSKALAWIEGDRSTH